MTETSTTTDELTNAGDDSSAAMCAQQRIRYRVRFAKTGLLRWIGHQDMIRLWERIARRADLKLSMTEGFTPKPRFVFPSALALGAEGVNEVVEIELAESIAPTEMLNRLVRDNQPGLSINRVSRLPDGFGKAQLIRTDYRVSAPTGVDGHDVVINWNRIGESIDALLSKESITIERKKKAVTLVVQQQIHELRVDDESIVLSLIATNSASLRPNDVLTLLSLDNWIDGGATITRTNVHLDNEFETSDLDEIATRKQSPPASMRLTQTLQSHQAGPTPVRGA
ncbi:hypothetical protein Poly51_14170 [Rubripirellula tenax]|uniref:DUF2344 domain-containing protein n=1 Tax=Rubripirellula tenax TaxID=2528015 RepID=A0A5C6FB38_9BACT|nr:TIGR03936 family radical SAM-associated protein [Rubripirellula tenax]TWU58638.1 hypothetical protein Poly51_14170 [Rubripirellula tenax]